MEHKTYLDTFLYLLLCSFSYIFNLLDPVMLSEKFSQQCQVVRGAGRVPYMFIILRSPCQLTHKGLNQ